MSTTTTLERITKEYNDNQKDPPEGCSSCLENDEDMYHWKATILGPENSPYEFGVFFLDIEFPSDYPYNPPKIQFTTKIYHPNIDSDGRILVASLFANGWDSCITIHKVLQTIRWYLLYPNELSFMSQENAELDG